MALQDHSHDVDDVAEQRRIALDAITDFAYVFDLEGRFRFINKPLLDLWGLSLEEARGKNFFELHYPPELAAKLQAQIQEVIETKQRIIDETPYTSPAGVAGFYQYIFSPVMGAGGKVEAVAGSTRDISDYKRIEKDRHNLTLAVEAARARLAAIIQSAPAFICTLRGPEHIFELANERYYELIGRRDIIGKPVREALPEIEGQGFVDLLDKVFRTGESFTGNEMPVRLKRSGDNTLELVYMNFVYQKLPNVDGGAATIFVHGVDVTDSVRSRAALLEREERLRTSEERLAFALDAADLGTFYCPVPLGKIVWNATCKAHFWLPADAEVNFDLFYSIIHPLDREPVRTAIERAIFGRQPYDVEYRTMSGEGQVRWVRAKGRAYYNSAGEPTRFDGVTLDVTEHKRAETALKESEGRFRQIADTMPQIVWAAKPDGVLDYYNRRWLEFIKKTTYADLDEIRWDRYVHPDDMEKAGNAWEHAIRTGETYHVEFRVRSGDGSYCWFLVRAVPVRNDCEQIIRWFGTCTDIDAIKRLTGEREHLLQSERAARSEAENANRAKDHFIAVLSHELRTPLAPVVMTVPAMEIDPDLPFKFREDLAMIRRNIDLEVKLIDDLLDLSRVTTGKLRLHMQPVSVHEVLRHAIHSSLSDTGGKQLHVVQDFTAVNDQLIADPARLQQVFWNLLRNAVKFTPGEGTITVRTRQVSGDRGAALRVEVSDSGVGIPPQVLPRIFDAFEQGDARVTRQFGGLGLGLAIAKAVVERHGGTISAASPGVGRGATFAVELPASASAERPPTALAPGRPSRKDPSRPARVLLVEDHTDTARIMMRVLAASGFDIKIARSVAAALELAAAEPFDVLISDIGLPDASGYDLMRQIQARWGIKGIALSGYGMEEDARKSREAGFAEHLVKPVDIAHLEAVLRRLIDEP